MRTIAIIPARGGSKRLQGKNTRPFLGLPLIHWSIAFARNIASFDRVIVSTDDAELAAVARSAGADVPYLRPAELATDTATTASAVLDVLDREAERGSEFDVVALLQPTSPMRRRDRWLTAFERLDDPACDAAVGVAPARNHPYHVFEWGEQARLQPFVSPDGLRLRSQDLPPAIYVAGNLYLVRTTALVREGTFFPARTSGVLCDLPYEAVDIDTESDWIAAEAIGRYFDQQPEAN